MGFGELTTASWRRLPPLGVPVVLLKFAALRAGGFVADGLRVAGDVDALAPPDRARCLAEALGPQGLTPAGFGDTPHHLASLRDADGRGLDLHVHVPGLHVGRGFPATCADLVEAGLLRRTGLPGECFLPCLPVLVAHAVVHALSQHGYAPHVYPPLRLVGDLLDLGAAADDGELARTALPFVEDEVTAAETAAAVALSRRLGEGDADLFEASSTTSPEGLLLRHLVAGLLDDDYRSALRLRKLQALGRRAKGPGERVAVLAKHAWRALLLTDAQIDVLYGRPRSRLGYVGRRLARPFDLAGRAARMVVGSLRLRLRR